MTQSENKKLQKSCLGSSETTREAPLPQFEKGSDFDFDPYLCPQHKQKDPYFLQWFIGFVEGDGCFTIRTDEEKPRLVFEIVQKDPKLIHRLHTELGFGSVTKMEHLPGHWKYAVYDKKGLIRIVTLFAGNLILPKRILQFEKWVQEGTSVGLWDSDFSQEVKNRMSRRPTITLQDAWLSGFAEAEGCFYANLRYDLANPRVNQKFTITQQDIAGEREILEHIIRLLESNNKVSHVSRNNYRLELSSLKCAENVIEYFSKFKLRGKKYIAFRRWWRVFLRRQANDFRGDPKKIDSLQKLCWAINSQTAEQIAEKQEKFQANQTSNKKKRG